MSFDLTALSRDVLRLRGADTLPLLQGLLTGNMDELAEGRALYAALLTPQGKIVETMFLTLIGEDLYIDVPTGRGAAFAKKLMLYRLRAKVAIEEVPVSVGVALTSSDIPEEGVTSAPDPRHADLGHRFLTENHDLPQAENLYLTYQAALGIADMNAGFGEAEVFPLDVNLDALHGIDHKKGCFVGQEVASRMFRKGEVRKRTFIALGADVTPGTPLKQNDRTVGEIRYAQGDVALAMVRLDRLDADSDSADADGQTVTLIKPSYLL